MTGVDTSAAGPSPHPRRLIIASELMYPELTSTGYYVSAIARDLATAVPVTVICGQPTYSARGTRAPHRETWHGVDIRRCRGTTFDKNHVLGRLANMVTLGTSAFIAAWRTLGPGDVAFVFTNPPVLPALVAVACRWRGAACVPVIHDHYPDLLVAAAGISERSVVARLLRAANRWLFAGAAQLAADPRFHLLVIGDGARRAWFEAGVRARGLQNVSVLGPRPRAQQHEFLNACDIGLVTLVSGMWGVSVPSRLYNFLAAGKPILAVVEAGSEVDLVIREEAVGWSTPPGDVAAFVSAVREADDDAAALETMGRRARAAADRAYAGPTSLAYYRGLALSLLGAGPR